MTETIVQKQVRLVLEQQCAEVFMKVLAPEYAVRGFEVTLFFFDFGDKGNVAYKTSLKRDQLNLTLLALLTSKWGRSETRFIPDWIKHMEADNVIGLGKAIEALGPAGVGYALLVGTGENAQYMSNGDRRGVIEMFTDFLERESNAGLG